MDVEGFRRGEVVPLLVAYYTSGSAGLVCLGAVLTGGNAVRADWDQDFLWKGRRTSPDPMLIQQIFHGLISCLFSFC